MSFSRRLVSDHGGAVLGIASVCIKLPRLYARAWSWRRTALAAKVRHDSRVHLIAFLPSFCSFQGTAFLLRIDPLKRLNCSLVQVQEIWIVAEALERFVERHGACAEVAERAPATAVRGVEQHDLVAVAGQA